MIDEENAVFEREWCFKDLKTTFETLKRARSLHRCHINPYNHSAMGQYPWDSLVNNSWDLYMFIQNMEQVSIITGFAWCPFF